jgi:hypothetical protein
VHDESQVRKHQLARRIEVGLQAEPRGERDFVILAEHRNLRNAIDVRVQAADGAGEHQTSLLSD